MASSKTRKVRNSSKKSEEGNGSLSPKKSKKKKQTSLNARKATIIPNDLLDHYLSLYGLKNQDEALRHLYKLYS